MTRPLLVTTLAGAVLVAAACTGASGSQPSGQAAGPGSAAGTEFPALQVTAAVPGVFYPAALADTGDAVWALGHSDAKWRRIDPATNAVTDTVSLGGAYATGGALEGGRLWALDFTDRTVVAVDPATRKVTSAIDVGLDGGWLLGGEGAVWVVGNDAHEVLRIDPASEEVTRLAIGRACGSTPAVGGGFLWMLSASGHLCKLDPGTGKVLAELDGIAAAPSLFWAADRLVVPTEEGGVQLVDPVTLSIAATVPPPPLGTFGGARYSLGAPGESATIVGDGDAVWVRYLASTVGRLDLADDPTWTVYAGLPAGNDALGVLRAFDSLWFGDVDGSTVVRTAIP